MRIHNPNLDPSTAAHNRPEPATRVDRGQSSIVPSGSGARIINGDQATLGSSAVDLTARVLAQPDVRADLVQQFRAQIAGGTYVVAPSNVAEAMLSDPQAGLGTRGNG